MYEDSERGRLIAWGLRNQLEAEMLHSRAQMLIEQSKYLVAASHKMIDSTEMTLRELTARAEQGKILLRQLQRLDE